MIGYLIYILNLIWYCDIVYNVLMYFAHKRIPNEVDFGTMIVIGILLVRIDLEQVGKK